MQLKTAVGIMEVREEFHKFPSSARAHFDAHVCVR
jgi:hypothetical protein